MIERTTWPSTIMSAFFRLCGGAIASIIGVVIIMVGGAMGGGGEGSFFLWWFATFFVIGWALLPIAYMSKSSAGFCLVFWIGLAIFSLKFGTGSAKGYSFIPWVMSSAAVFLCASRRPPSWFSKEE